jgi:glucuronate isomerase
MAHLSDELYDSVAGLPLVSPHGHIDVQLFAEPGARLDPPGRLFVSADHYLVRMLYSQGVPLERVYDASDSDVWQLLADNIHLFALTPSGLWLRETLAIGADDLRARRGAACLAGLCTLGAARPLPC